MPRGGHRAGAGRKKGSRTIRTARIAEQAAAEGITPLEVMLTAMRRHAQAGQWDQAAVFAKDAAPYMHPRLQAIQHTGANGGPIQTEDVSARDVLADRLACLTARGGAAEDPGKPH
jgi:hypothetical protein